MAQNVSQLTATGSYSDTSTANVTLTSAWTVSDTSIVTIGAATGVPVIQSAGKIWGGDVGVTATLAPGTPGTASLLVIASDSGSVSPRMPQQDNHWQALGISPWGGWWGCQEASGHLIGSGSVPFNLFGANQADLIYANPVTDWTRTGLTLQKGVGNARGWSTSASLGPNIQTTSVAWLAYVKTIPTAGLRVMYGFSVGPGVVQQVVVQQQTTGIPRLVVSGTATAATTTHDDGRVHPYLIVLDRTNSRVKLYTDLDKVTGSYPVTALYDVQKGFSGIAGQASGSGTLVFSAYCTGSVAESYSDNGKASDLLRRLGWSPNW